MPRIDPIRRSAKLTACVTPQQHFCSFRTRRCPGRETPPRPRACDRANQPLHDKSLGMAVRRRTSQLVGARRAPPVHTPPPAARRSLGRGEGSRAVLSRGGALCEGASRPLQGGRVRRWALSKAAGPALSMPPSSGVAGTGRYLEVVPVACAWRARTRGAWRERERGAFCPRVLRGSAWQRAASRRPAAARGCLAGWGVRRSHRAHRAPRHGTAWCTHAAQGGGGQGPGAELAKATTLWRGAAARYAARPRLSLSGCASDTPNKAPGRGVGRAQRQRGARRGKGAPKPKPGEPRVPTAGSAAWLRARCAAARALLFPMWRSLSMTKRLWKRGRGTRRAGVLSRGGSLAARPGRNF